MTDPEVLRPGLAADLVVFDRANVQDHATCAYPTLATEGIVHTLVNGEVAWRDCSSTKLQAGRALRCVRPGNLQ